MLTISQIAAIIMLLTAFGVDPITTADVQRILEGQPTITSSATTTMTQAQPPAPSAGNGATTSQTEPTTVSQTAPVATAPASKARIDIINPLAGKGLNRKITTSTEFDQNGQPMNEVEVGAVVYDDQGEPTRTADMQFSVKSPSGLWESPVYHGSGGVIPIYPNGQKLVVPFYLLHYEFKTAGDHVITFSSNGISQSVTVTVSE